MAASTKLHHRKKTVEQCCGIQILHVSFMSRRRTMHLSGFYACYYFTMTISQIKIALGKAYDAFVLYLKNNNMSIEPLLGPNQQAIKKAVVDNLNKHITLNAVVPPDLGCAETISFILNAAGVPNIPAGGFPGTAGLYQYMNVSNILINVDVPLPYDIIISPTGTSSINSPHGHTGILGENNEIYSNSSDTGLFTQNYTLDTWKQYFGEIEGFPQYYFRWI